MKTKHRIWIKIRLEWCWSWVPGDKVNVAQSCLTLCDRMDYTVHEILQARILEWVVFPFSRGSSQPRDWTQISHIAGRFFTIWATREAPFTCMLLLLLSRFSRVWLFATLWTVALQAPLSMELFRPDYWNRLPFPSRGDLPNPGIEPRPPAFHADFFTDWSMREAQASEESFYLGR